MADYSDGLQRSSYLQGSGLPIDTLGVRSLGDPTPAWVYLLADIDRLQWGIMGDWGHPSYFVSCAARDGGYTGTSGSYSATAATFPLVLIVPPRVEYAHVGIYLSGGLTVKITNAHDTTGIQLGLQASVGSGEHFDINNAAAAWTEGVDTNGGLKPRALKVSGSGTNDANTTAVACEVSVSRNDITPSDNGDGGILWGLRFVWDRGPLGTFKPGATTADSITI